MKYPEYLEKEEAQGFLDKEVLHRLEGLDEEIQAGHTELGQWNEALVREQTRVDKFTEEINALRDKKSRKALILTPGKQPKSLLPIKRDRDEARDIVVEIERYIDELHAKLHTLNETLTEATEAKIHLEGIIRVHDSGILKEDDPKMLHCKPRTEPYVGTAREQVEQATGKRQKYNKGTILPAIFVGYDEHNQPIMKPHPDSNPWPGQE